MGVYAFLIPVYRHGLTLDYVISSLVEYNLPIIVVDDGNVGADRDFISAAGKKYKSVIIVRSDRNRGKGSAVNAGIVKAHELGFTHVFQIDSDGQHDPSGIGFFLEQSKRFPDAVICGYPDYDDSVPKARLNGRKIANLWIHIVTLSPEIKDALIGFRVYPVGPYYKILKRHSIIDSRMGFDIDILVHLSWENVRIVSHPVKISYPIDGISNFRVVRDNIRISLTYTRLCIGMIFRFPILLFRALKRKNNGKALV